MSLAAMDKEVLVGTSGPPSSSDSGEPSGGGNGGSGFGKHGFLAGGGPLLQQGFPQKLCYSVSCHGQIRIPLSICIYIYISFFYACAIYK